MKIEYMRVGGLYAHRERGSRIPTPVIVLANRRLELYRDWQGTRTLSFVSPGRMPSYSGVKRGALIARVDMSHADSLREWQAEGKLLDKHPAIRELWEEVSDLRTSMPMHSGDHTKFEADGWKHFVEIVQPQEVVGGWFEAEAEYRAEEQRLAELREERSREQGELSERFREARQAVEAFTGMPVSSDAELRHAGTSDWGTGRRKVATVTLPAEEYIVMAEQIRILTQNAEA